MGQQERNDHTTCTETRQRTTPTPTMTKASAPLLGTHLGSDEEDGYVACDALTHERRRQRTDASVVSNWRRSCCWCWALVVLIGVWTTTTIRSRRRGEGKLGLNDWSLEPPPENPRAPVPILFELSAGCVDESVRASRPGFFSRKIVAAYVAKHNYKANIFFDVKKHGLEMHRKQRSTTERCYQRAAGTICPESDHVFELFSTEVNWEWGYVLKNDLGGLFYEIGRANQHPLHGRTCKDTQMYGKYWNRLATLEKKECPGTRCSGNMTGAKLADYVFGECSMRQCPPPPCECAQNTWCSDFDCVAQCPPGQGGTGNTLSTRKCIDCPEGCSACLNDVCTACDDGKLFHNGMCVDTCPDGYGIASGACVECVNPKPFVHNDECARQCPVGYGPPTATSGTCSECSAASCDRCVGDVCTRCADGTFLSDGECVNTCPYGQGGQDDGTCVPCEHKVVNNTCLDECPSGYGSHNDVDKECRSCGVKDCYRCSGLPLTCDSCMYAKFLHNHHCVLRCPQGFVPGRDERLHEVSGMGYGDIGYKGSIREVPAENLTYFASGISARAYMTHTKFTPSNYTESQFISNNWAEVWLSATMQDRCNNDTYSVDNRCIFKNPSGDGDANCCTDLGKIVKFALYLKNPRRTVAVGFKTMNSSWFYPTDWSPGSGVAIGYDKSNWHEGDSPYFPREYFQTARPYTGRITRGGGHQFWFDHDMIVDGVPSPSNEPDFTFEARKEDLGQLKWWGVQSISFRMRDGALMLGDLAGRVVAVEDPLHSRTCVPRS